MISKQAIWLELANLVFLVYLFIQSFYIPESPRYLYSERDYDRSREGLTVVAGVNGTRAFSPDFIFDTEKEEEGLLMASENADIRTVRTQVKLDGGNVYGLS